MPHGEGWAYEVQLWPGEPIMSFYRAVKLIDGVPGGDDLLSNFHRGKRRRWPAQGGAEDACDYLALSCYDTHERANANALAYDADRRRGRTPRWNAVVELQLDPHEGQVCAQSFEEGHYSVWVDEPSRLQILNTLPITPQED